MKAAGLRDLLRLCLPAAILAIFLRAAILWFTPAAFVHNDTASIVETADRLVNQGALAIEGKKTFLVPLVYSVPAVAGIPILPFAAVVQHLLGVASVFVCGLLVRLWFRHWRVLVVPVTTLIALQPVLLWYEHAALAEIWAIFGALLVALAATVFDRLPNRYTLAFLFAATFFMAGARPEGHLFALFACTLVFARLWGNWKVFRIAVPATTAWTLLLFFLTRTGQSGLLLFTSVLHLTPERLVFSPGVAEATSALSTEARAQWSDKTSAPKLVPLRKALRDTLIDWQTADGIDAGTAADRVDVISGRAGIETSVRSALALPELAVKKFVVAHREPPAPPFGSACSEQFDVLYHDEEELKALRYAPLLWNRTITSPAEASTLLATIHRPVPGDVPTHMQDVWLRISLLPALPWNLPGASIDRVPVRGVPWLYLVALLGMVALALREHAPLGFHRLWGLFFISLFILLMVTANIRARFRILFEPFWLLYAFAWIDTVMIFASRLISWRSPTLRS